MKIVIIADFFSPSKGYLEYYLAKELAILNQQVFVLTPSYESEISRKRIDSGFDILQIPHLHFFPRIRIPTLKGINFVSHFLKKESPHLIHCQPLFIPLSLFVISNQKKFKYKVVGALISGGAGITEAVQNGIFQSNLISRKMSTSILRLVSQHYLKKHVSTFFTKSKEWKALTNQVFGIPLKKIRTIPLGADPNLFSFKKSARNEIRTLFGLSNDDILVTYSGKLIPSKRLEILLRSMALIMKTNSSVKMLIVGGGEVTYIKYLESLIRDLRIEKRVIFQSWVHRTKLANYFSASDIAVWPGTPSISIIEAASVGLPLIIQKNPLTSYKIANNNGFAFRKGDIKELHHFLELLIGDEKLRRAMGTRSRQLVIDKLNWETIVPEYLAEYKHITNF